jgi:flagellar motor switch protein FliG
MLELGNSEDPEFTRIALSYTFTFDEILTLGDLEFCEVMAESQPQVIGLAVQGLGPEVTARVLRSVKPAIAAAVREALDSPGSKTDISGARYKMITYARSAEKKGLLRVKRIPESL